ncbi:MAG TPA: hypothetical protein VKY32_00140 [Flavobacterium sp.]|nr:hypothetical protein [Flavobacterium sp.]
MRKFLIFTSALFLLASCKSKKVAVQAEGKTETIEKTEEKSEREIFYTEQVRNDFRAVSDKTRDEFLNGYRATDKKYSILFFTQGFNSEEVTVKNESDVLFKGLVTTDKSTGLAKNMRIVNTEETEIYDAGSKKTIYIAPEMASKYKFIYVMKGNQSEEKPYKITYSDNLRPAR